MSKRSPALLLDDMLQAAEKIQQYTNDFSFEEFEKDSKTKDAVIRNFEIIGEASNRLSKPFKNRHPNIDWAQIKGLRNRLVHDYIGIDYLIVWNITVAYLPGLIKELRDIISASD